MRTSIKCSFFVLVFLLSGCGVSEQDNPKSNATVPIVYVPFDWNSVTYDWNPPSLIASIRDSSGETGTPTASSAYVIIASDEPIGTNGQGKPSGSFQLEKLTAGLSAPDVSFADNTKKALRVNLNLATEGTFRLSFAIPDVRGNLTRGTLEFSTRGTQASASSLSAYADALTFQADNGLWTPSGSWYTPTPSSPSTFGSVQTISVADNPAGLPVFRPPVILDRVRGPNYTWLYSYSYQYACPAGYYCPPASSIVTNPPVIPAPILEGLAGEITKLCWELDCGGVLGDNLINRGIRAFVPRPRG